MKFSFQNLKFTAKQLGKLVNIMERSDKNQHIDAGENAITVVAAAAAKNDSKEKPPPYLKVIADCWEHVFDYLSFEDILNTGQTCKRMNQMAGYYVREYYPQLNFELIENEIRFKDVCLQVDFYPFITQLHISRDSELDFFSNAKTFDALKKIVFVDNELNRTQIIGMQNVLKNVEVIELSSCKIASNAYEQIANYCPKLKQMKVNGDKISNAAFSNYYPALERLELSKMHCKRLDKLKIFFEQHTNLKQFEIDYRFLWTNRDVLNQTNIQLDLLRVDYNRFDRTVPFEQFIDLLKTLYERGFYKALQLPFVVGPDAIDHEHLTNVLSSLPALERLSLLRFPFFDLKSLANLKELNVFGSFGYTINIETLAKCLPKLEQLTLGVVNTNDLILPFIRHSKRLKTIKIGSTNDFVLDLFPLNQERKKLENACQISIYVLHKSYLPTKWKSHNFNLELDLIRIMRLDYFDFFEHF